MEDERGLQCLVGLSWVDIDSPEGLLHILAQTNRTTRATAQNEQSSRSHALLQISVVEPAAQAWQSGAERYQRPLELQHPHCNEDFCPPQMSSTRSAHVLDQISPCAHPTCHAPMGYE